MDGFDLTPEEEAEIDRALQDDSLGGEEESLPEGWVHLSFAVPETFKILFLETLQEYQAVANTTKVFPALEAMVMEARNSLEQLQVGL